MTTIHENLVPTIPSGTLPQTPAAEWADSVQDSLGAHVTRTPVGTPGPKVPGGWNDEVEPPTGNAQDLRAYLPAQEDVQRALDGAKAYLPQGVAAYLPGTGTDSGAVDIGHGASVPYTEGGAQPYSTAVDVGPATGAPYTEGGAEPYGAGAGSDLGRSANATSLNETASALATGAASTLASAGQTAKAYLPEGVAAYLPGSTSSSTSSPQTPQPTSGTPVDLAPASTAPYTHAGVSPYGADAGAGSDLGAATTTSTTTSSPQTPQTSGGAKEVDMGPASSTTYTHSGVAPYGAHAGAGSDLGAAATPSIPNSTSASTNSTSNPNENENADPTPNATSTALLIADARARGAAPIVANSAHSTNLTASSSSSSGDSRSGSQQQQQQEQTPAPAPARATSGLQASHPAVGVEKQGSAALNSGRGEDNVPTGEDDAEGDDDDADADEEKTGGGKGKKGKKGKLMQRFKEKMHVGGA